MNKLRLLFKHIAFNFIRRYRRNPASRWTILVIDLFALLVAFAVTDLFRLRMSDYIDWPSLIFKYCFFGVIATIFYLIIGTYRSIIRHSGMYDIYKVLASNLAAALILIAFNFINNNHPIVTNRYTPAYSEILMTFSLQIVFMISIRLALQNIYNDYIRRQRPSVNIIIYGAGSAGTIAYNALMQDRNHNYRIVAYIDDARQKKDAALNGIHIMQRGDVLNQDFIKKNQVSTLLIAIPSIKLSYKQEITNIALDLGLKVKSVPHISKWINDSFTFNQIQDIKIEDLLERESIKLDNTNIVRQVYDKIVMVTGAAGSIGSEICRQLTQYHPAKIIMVDQAESPMYDLQFELRNTAPYNKAVDNMVFVIANIKDQPRMQQVFEQYHPQIIYHAAAYKHVPFMEENPYEALLVNVFGTKNIADLAMQDTGGQERRLSEWCGKGGYVLLEFWASWCAPCRKEMPVVVESLVKYQRKGFGVIGISLDTDEKAWKTAVSNLGMDWTQLSDLKGWKSDAAAVYGVSAIPSNVLLDGEGTIVAADLRGDELLLRLKEIYGY